MNAREARWLEGAFGAYTRFEGVGDARFPQLGINIGVLQPGQPACMYHAEDQDQEGFLVLQGEALLLVEGEERPLKAWDFFHCPAGTEHVIVGAGDGPCAVLAVGPRTGGGVRYLESEFAHGGKRLTLIRIYEALRGLGYEGGSRFYASNWPRWRATADAEIREAVRHLGGVEVSVDPCRDVRVAPMLTYEVGGGAEGPLAGDPDEVDAAAGVEALQLLERLGVHQRRGLLPLTTLERGEVRLARCRVQGLGGRGVQVGPGRRRRI